MVGIELPGEDRLPIGPVRNLVEALHGVYRGAGRPGLRRIAKAITEGDFRDTVSHEAVSDMLNGKSVPRWSKLECVVRQLAVWNSPRLDPDSTAARFLRLWEAATGTTAGVLSQTAFSPNPAGVHGSPAVGQPRGRFRLPTSQPTLLLARAEPNAGQTSPRQSPSRCLPSRRH